MIEIAFTVGILPQNLFEMELWEFNSCVRAYNDMKEKQTKNDFIKIWQTANLTGAAFSGKLKALSHYIKDDPQRIGQKLTRAQMDDFDTRLAAKGGSEYDSGNT